MFKFIAILLAGTIVVTGCTAQTGDRATEGKPAGIQGSSSASDTSNKLPGESEHKYVQIEPKPEPQDEWNAIVQQINEHHREIEERHSIKMLAWGAGKDHIMMQIRGVGAVGNALSDEETEAVKTTIFELVGKPFPLQMSVRSCCDREPEITGTITVYDQASDRILIENKQKTIGDSDLTEATWISLEEDGVLLVGGDKTADGFGESLVGREAKAWTTGLMLNSYPGQTSALKVEVE